MGSFLIMGLFGIIIASLVNMFLGSSMLQFMVSVIGVLVFAGLTAWDTQRLKNDYIYGYAVPAVTWQNAPRSRGACRSTLTSSTCSRCCCSCSASATDRRPSA